MKILVVDDETINREMMKGILSSFGECHTAENGQSAIKSFQKALLKKTPYDLITLDVSMPDIDGTKVLYEIRNTEKIHGIEKDDQVKIIMVTAKADKDTVIECIKIGCNDYVTKPLDIKKMNQKLKSIGIIQL